MQEVENKKEKYTPLSRLDVRYWIKASKIMRREDVEKLQGLLRQKALDCGCEEGVPALISSLTARFADEERVEMMRRMDEHVRRLGIMAQKRIDADDKQIVQAIKWTLKDFESEKDWGGVYRILVDYCLHLDFTNQKTSFVKRFAKMGIYPKDDTVKDFDPSVPPAIYKDEYNGKPFSYYAIDKGLGPYWPTSYQDWQTSDIATNDFIQRRKIANLFLKNLLKATESG